MTNDDFMNIGLITARLLQGLTVIADGSCLVIDFAEARLRVRGHKNDHAERIAELAKLEALHAVYFQKYGRCQGTDSDAYVIPAHAPVTAHAKLKSTT